MHTRVDGEALQRARSAKGLTQRQLARMVHIRRVDLILRFERGAMEPNPRMLRALAEALSVEPVQLLFMPNGSDLKALRLVSGLSAADLAKSAHVSLPSYREWESGHSLPLANSRILSVLARTLNVSTAEIVSALKRPEAASRERGDSDGQGVCGQVQGAHSSSMPPELQES